MDAEDIATLVNNLKLSSEAKERAVTITTTEAARERKRIEQVVVGKIFARKLVNSETLRSNLLKILRTRERLEVEIVGHNMFIISFSLLADKKTALEEGPWHFFQDLMILKQTEPMQTPTEVEFNDISLWVLCHNVPFDCMEPAIIKRIGERVGLVQEIDVGESGLCLGKFARVRGERPIDKPFVRCVPLTHERSTKEVLVLLQYEKLPVFFFKCGRVGHISKDCWDQTADKNQCPYESWLRAGHSAIGLKKGKNTNVGAQSHGPSQAARDREFTDSGNGVREMVGETRVCRVEEEGRAKGGSSKNDIDIRGCQEIEIVRGTEKVVSKVGREGTEDRGSSSSSMASLRDSHLEPIFLDCAPLLCKGKATISKELPSRKEWKRQAREMGKKVANNNVMHGEKIKLGARRGGMIFSSTDDRAPAEKQRKLVDEISEEEMENVELTAEAATQPRRSL